MKLLNNHTYTQAYGFIQQRSRVTYCRFAAPHSLQEQGPQGPQLVDIAASQSTHLVASLSSDKELPASRRITLAAAVAALFTAESFTVTQRVAAVSGRVDPQLIRAFQDAMAATTYEVRTLCYCSAAKVFCFTIPRQH